MSKYTETNTFKCGSTAFQQTTAELEKEKQVKNISAIF